MFNLLIDFLQYHVQMSYSKVVSVMVAPASEVLTATVLYSFVSEYMWSTVINPLSSH